MALWAEGKAQSPEAPGPARRHATEWGLASGGAADLPGSTRGGEFWAVQLRWGKVLTAPHGPGALRGTLEYAFEIVPAMALRQAEAPGGFRFRQAPDFVTSATASRESDGALFGGGINPFFWQYNFTAHPRLVPYLQLGAGLLFTTRDFPAGTSSFNFTPQGGVGAYWFTSPRRAVSVGVRYHHTSNAGTGRANPGHNALYFYAGLSWWR
ncbi:MAG TPA: acyloxyacyl hydrolase [Terriglobia bacterium]|nr:acyloxyacyl hydrolase [Terriglobia bacterium]